MTVADRLSEWLPVMWFALVVVVLILLWMSGTLDRLATRLTKFGGFGLSFEFTEQSARETRDSVEQGLGAIRTAIRRKLAADVRTAGLQDAFEAVVRGTKVLSGKKGYRATIHIPDPLYANQLYQLLEYVPKGGGSGRTFSTRAGIIGMAWRNRESDTWYQAKDISETQLMRQWGMTAREARLREATDTKKLFLAVPLFDKTGVIPIGVFYFDAEDRGKLGLPPTPDPTSTTDDHQVAPDPEAEKLLKAVEDQFVAAFGEKLAEALASLVAQAKRESPQLELEGQ